MKKFIYTLLFILIFMSACNDTDTTPPSEISEASWWPEQPVPDGLVVAKKGGTHGENALIASVAGLVAMTQKTGALDELVWIETGGLYEKWYANLVMRIGAEERGEFDAMELLKRYQDEDFIKGYILYNPEENSELRDDMDFSYNIAASYAGAESAIIIDETLEPAIKELGYTKLLDASEISRNDYFDNLKDRKNKNLIVTMSPSFHNNIDFAIANNAMVSYNTDEVTDRIMQWVNPISPVVGWNHGDEHVFTILATQYGLFNTASDWASNLISLSAGALDADFQKINTLDPGTIDFDKEGNFHSIVLSDGDNMQWTMGSFLNNPDFWANDSHGEYPIGFTSCPINISLMAPEVLDEMARTQPEHSTIIEYGPGGYQYPDMFAQDRGEDQAAIQREFARKINRHVQRTGATVIGFISMDVRSQAAIDAYKIYAEEIEGITGMIAVQYAPYHGGEGDVIWVKNKQGVEIPVATARYSLWQGLNTERSGNVEMVANAINKDVEGNTGVMDWTAVHAWSEFENPANRNEKGVGLDPMRWTLEQLNEDINIVSPEELLWRIRMEHNKEQTMDIISQ